MGDGRDDLGLRHVDALAPGDVPGDDGDAIDRAAVVPLEAAAGAEPELGAAVGLDEELLLGRSRRDAEHESRVGGADAGGIAVGILRLEEIVNRLAEDLVLGPAEHPRSGAIPARDVALAIEDNHRVSQPGNDLLQRAQRLLLCRTASNRNTAAATPTFSDSAEALIGIDARSSTTATASPGSPQASLPKTRALGPRMSTSS